VGKDDDLANLDQRSHSVGDLVDPSIVQAVGVEAAADGRTVVLVERPKS